MKFIAKNDISRQLVDETVSLEEVYEHFQKYDDEVLYVLSSQEELTGIITPGDVYRYLICEKDSFINKNYKCLSALDYKEAEVICGRIASMHEIPVVEENDFWGIITNEKKKDDGEWEKIRSSHVKAGNLEKKNYLLPILEKLLNIYERENIQFYLLDLSSCPIVSNTLRKKQCYPNGIKGFLSMSESEKKDFYGDDYYVGKAEKFAEDYDLISTKMVNGRAIIEDMKTQHINVSNGHRKVNNAPNSVQNRIYLAGPCNVFGAYVQDNRTIGYYLQDLINQTVYNQYEVVVASNLGGEQYRQVIL